MAADLAKSLFTPRRIALIGASTDAARLTAQPMAKGVGEAILGYCLDPLVGPIVALGAGGGILAEIFRDIVLHIAPVSEARGVRDDRPGQRPRPARGYRGLPKGDLAALAKAIAAFSHLAAIPAVTEAEINPLIIMPEGQGVVMADALLSQIIPAQITPST